MKKSRSQQEQAVAVSRVRAAASLQPHRPKAHDTAKRYIRTRQKRLWHKDQEALSHWIGHCGGAIGNRQNFLGDHRNLPETS